MLPIRIYSEDSGCGGIVYYADYLRYLTIFLTILFFLPSISFAEGIVTAVKGTSLVMKAGQDWSALKEGDILQEGAVIRIGVSSSVVLKVGDDYVELSGKLEDNDIKIVKFSPFEVRPLPEPPALSPPSSTKTSTTLRWKRKGEDERYHLQISKNKEFSETTVDLPSIDGPRVTVGMLEEGDYFARVSAIDEAGFEGRFSEPQPFYVGPKVPSSNIAPLMIMFGVAFMLLGF